MSIENSQKILFNRSRFKNNYSPKGCVFAYNLNQKIAFNNLDIIDNYSDSDSGSEEGNYFVRTGGEFIEIDSTNFVNNKYFSLIGVPKENIKHSNIGNMSYK